MLLPSHPPIACCILCTTLLIHAGNSVFGCAGATETMRTGLVLTCISKRIELPWSPGGGDHGRGDGRGQSYAGILDQGHDHRATSGLAGPQDQTLLGGRGPDPGFQRSSVLDRHLYHDPHLLETMVALSAYLSVSYTHLTLPTNREV